MAHLDINNPSIWTGFSVGNSSGVSIQTLQIYGTSSAGVVITEEVALQLATVWACVKVISEDISAMPWHVFERVDNENRKRRSDHMVETILNVQPNEENDAFTFRELMLRWALSFGNAYAEIERNKGNRITALWPIHPENVRLMRDANTGDLIYVVKNEHMFSQKEIIHIKGPSPDGLNGWPVLAMALHTIGLGIASEQYGSEYFANGTHLTGLLKVPGVLTDENKKNLRDAWSRMYEGPTNRHRFAILDGGIEWTSLGDGVTNTEAEFLGTRKFQVNEIARWFRVPPHKIMSLENATFTNIEHQSLEYLSDTLLPWISRLEHEMNRKLFMRKDLFSRIMMQSQLRSDSEARANFYSRMFNMGALSINEIRQKEEQNPIGTEGDERFMQSGMATVKQIVAGVTNTTTDAPLTQGGGNASDLDIEAQAYAPILFDFFADADSKKFKKEFLTDKLLQYARTILRTHGIRDYPENLENVVIDFVIFYKADRIEKPASEFVSKVLRSVYDD